LDLKVIRDTGSTDGALVTVTHGSGAGNMTKRLSLSGDFRSAVGPGAGAAYIDFFGCDAPKVSRLTMKLDDTASTEYAIKFRPNTDDITKPEIYDVDVVGGATMFAAAVWCSATNSLS